jgi:hypothetical protein
MLHKNRLAICLFLLALGTRAPAQTTVTTTGGTANVLAKFTASSSIGNSAIVEAAGSVGIGTSNPSALLSLMNPFTVPNTNTLLGAGYAQGIGIHGNRQFWLQQWVNSATARQFLVGNGFVSGTGTAVPNNGPYTSFEALEFQDGYFGLVWNNGGSIAPAVTVNPTNGFVGIGTSSQSRMFQVYQDPVTLSFTSGNNAQSGLRGMHLNKASSDGSPLGISLDVGATPLWDTSALDYQNVDLVLAYDHTLPGDVIRVSPGGLTAIGPGVGSPSGGDAQLSVAGSTGKNGLHVGIKGVQYGLYMSQNGGSTYRTSINFNDKWLLGNDYLNAGTYPNGQTFFLYDYLNAAYRVLVKSSGDVGINTVSPAEKLEVNGNIKLTSGSGGAIIFADGTRQSTAATSPAHTLVGITAGSGLTGSGTTGNVSLAVDGTVARTNRDQAFNGDLTVNGSVTAKHIYSADFTSVISGSCLTESPAAAYVLNGLGQTNTTDCTFGPGTPINPMLGAVIPYSGILSTLQVVQRSLSTGGNFGGVIQVYTEPFNGTSGWAVTTLTCTLTASSGNPLYAATNCSDRNHTVSVTAGQKILVLVTPPSNGNNAFAPVAATLSIMF